MRFWEENKKLISFAGTSLFAMLLFIYWSTFPWPFTKDPKANKYERILAWPWGHVAFITERKILNVVKTLGDYFPPAELEPAWQSPTAEAVEEARALIGIEQPRTSAPAPLEFKEGTVPLRSFQKELGVFEEDLDVRYDGLQEALAHVTYEPFRIPKWEEQPGFYFMKTMQQIQKELKNIAEEIDEKNPLKNTIGCDFETKLGYDFVTPPAKAKVPFLLIQLGIIRDAIELAFRNGILQVTKINPAQTFDKSGSVAEIFFNEYPVQFTMYGDYPSVMKFLNSLDGVHGELVQDPITKFLYINRGSRHGLREGERIVISRDTEFVTTATVVSLQDEKARLDFKEFNDGHPQLTPKEGDRAWNHFYVLRTMSLKPVTQPPPHVQAGIVELSVKIAAVRFLENATDTGKSKAAEGGKKKKLPPGFHNYRY